MFYTARETQKENDKKKKKKKNNPWEKIVANFEIKTQMWRTDSLEKTLILGEIEGRRKRGWQRLRWLHGIPDSMDMSLGKLREILKDREAWCIAVKEVSKSWTQLHNWTTKTCTSLHKIYNQQWPQGTFLSTHYMVFFKIEK